MQHNFAPPDLEKMTWKCHCCDKPRTCQYIKVAQHDVSDILEMEPSSIIRNIRYCVDMPQCKDKAFDREWVLNTFFKRYLDEKI